MPMIQNLQFSLRNGLRWRIRRFNALLPARRLRRNPGELRTILVLFAGTYGDFVQVLPMLAEAAALWPKAQLHLYGSRSLLREFAFALPPRVVAAGLGDLLRFFLKPADLLLTTPIGVYRVRYDLLAWRLGRWCGGFRHAEEEGRSSYHFTLPLTRETVNFSEAAQQLPAALAARKDSLRPIHPLRLRVDEGSRFPFQIPVLFSLGGTGFLKALGLADMLRLIGEMMDRLSTTQVTLLAGPDDGELVSHLRRCYPDRQIWQYPPEELADRIRTWPGGLIGFDSFIAHFSLYLGKRMVVVHREKIPPGYDCAPFHRQIVLKKADGYDLAELGEFLAELGWRQELPTSGRPGQILP